LNKKAYYNPNDVSAVPFFLSGTTNHRTKTNIWKTTETSLELSLENIHKTR
jgi:hypothetical protein